ncbi:MAG: hypothetical protein JXA49_07125 [Actinobacteria bacterium]|nr:hypothetical protein [Actinomycetota bacterium]
MPERLRNLMGLFKRKNGFSAEEIITMVNAMNENKLTEITLQERGRTLTIKRSQDSNNNNDSTITVSEKTPDTVDQRDKTLKAITSPAVGIFHLSPNAGSAHFVSEGQVIEPGQVVGMIETLKVMSEVKSDSHGRVASIEVKNGDMVEFGQTLLLYEVID